MPTDSTFAPGDYPALFRAADASSLAGQRWYSRLTGLELSFVLLGGAAGTLGFIGGPQSTIASIVAAVSFVGAGAAKLLARQRGYERDWFNGRAVAETVKSLTWRYLTRTPPFAVDTTADEEFVRQIRASMRMRPSLHLSPMPGGAGGGQITDGMRRMRRLPWPDRMATYLQARVNEEAEWYRRRARSNQRSRDAWFFVSLGAQCAAAVLAISGVFSASLAELNLLGFAASLAAAAAAWSQFGRHEENSRAYALAFQELLLIAALAPSIRKEEQLNGLVVSGEAAISREHTMWVAKRTESLQDLGE